ncbi:MAG: diphosphate--fructose-6-phosphate 1-phosphotransferase [Candidatus Poribacteria bacterium]
MANQKFRMGILVGGGPAPGINGVISAATIKAELNGLEVIGIYDGFRWLIKKDESHVRNLTIDDVSRIHFDGGSILRTRRDSLLKEDEEGNLVVDEKENFVVDEKKVQAVVETLKALKIRRLVTIGGDDTAFSAREVCKGAKGKIKVAHVPKTIDNDIPLPDDAPTFGFQTARHLGAQLVANIMEDSKTTDRWYFVETMGRKAGHLALGIGMSAGATLTIIGEEFPEERIQLQKVSDILKGAIIKRRADGKNSGVAVIAEGVTEKLDPEEIKAKYPWVKIETDPFGHRRLSEINLAEILKREVQAQFQNRGEKLPIVDLKFGYELRCAPPIPYDCEYVRILGYGAVGYLLGEISGPADGALVCLEDGKLTAKDFEYFRDEETGRTKVRQVDINSGAYTIAKQYMIRLKPEDFEDAEQLKRLAEAAKMTPDEFKAGYDYLVQ